MFRSGQDPCKLSMGFAEAGRVTIALVGRVTTAEVGRCLAEPQHSLWMVPYWAVTAFIEAAGGADGAIHTSARGGGGADGIGGGAIHLAAAGRRAALALSLLSALLSITRSKTESAAPARGCGAGGLITASSVCQLMRRRFAEFSRIGIAVASVAVANASSVWSRTGANRSDQQSDERDSRSGSARITRRSSE